MLLSMFFAILTPFITAISGKILYKNAECGINGTFGYRTSRSMSSRYNWVYANKLCGKILFYGGLAAAAVSIFAVFLAYVISGEEAAFWISVILNILTAAMIVAAIPYIENRLKNLAKENVNKNDKN